MEVETSKAEELAALFRALGDPTRLRILEMLCGCSGAVEIDPSGGCRPTGALSVGEVCCRFEQSMSTVSHHLKELRLAGLIRMEKRGRSIFCSVDAGGLARVRRYLESLPEEVGACGLGGGRR